MRERVRGSLTLYQQHIWLRPVQGSNCMNLCAPCLPRPTGLVHMLVRMSQRRDEHITAALAFVLGGLKGVHAPRSWTWRTWCGSTRARSSGCWCWATTPR
jgi:hypothetical protein